MDQLVGFWHLAEKLKEEKRRGWIETLDLARVESVADHSFGVALLALFEGERRGYDVGRILRLAIIHDLDEAITGDLTPENKRGLGTKRVRRDRRLAVERILAQMPAKVRAACRLLWRDLDNRRSREARLVHDLDKLEMALQAHEYGKQFGRTKIARFYMSARRETTDPALKRIISNLVLKP